MERTDMTKEFTCRHLCGYGGMEAIICFLECHVNVVTVAAATSPPAALTVNSSLKMDTFLFWTYLRDPQCSVNGQAWAKACE